MGRLWVPVMAVLVVSMGCSLLNEPRSSPSDGSLNDGTPRDGVPQDGCTPSCGSRTCGSDGCGGVCGTCTGSTACNAVGTCAAPVLVDHFDDLSSWANTTNSTTAWTIDTAGYVGTGAKSQCGGAGFGDQLQRTIDFATNSTLRIWANKMNFDFIAVTLKLDGVAKATYSGDMSGFGVWQQLEISVLAGSHVVRIESDLAGTAWVDELEVFSTP